jgi:hypothetical protein
LFSEPIHTFNLTSLNVVRNGLRTSALNLAANTVRRTQNLLNHALQALGERLEAHCPGNLDDLVQGNRLGVLDILLLFAVTGRFLQGLDDQSRGSRDDGDGGLTVLNSELNGDSQTFLDFAMSSVGCSAIKIRNMAMPTQSPVALAISSPTFFGDRPRGPILGARADEAPTSPPVARRVLYISSQSHFAKITAVTGWTAQDATGVYTHITLISLGSNLGAAIVPMLVQFNINRFEKKAYALW